MRAQLRPNQFLRMIENRFVTSEEAFITPEEWDACVDPDAHPLGTDKRLKVWVGADAGWTDDYSAVVACAHIDGKVRLVDHRIFKPQGTTLDFESTIERTILDLHSRFDVKEVRYDATQLVATSQRLHRAGVRMEKFSFADNPMMANNLSELIRSRSLVLYPDDEMRLAALRTVAVETARGWKLDKRKQSHKIDVIVALGYAALATVEAQRRRDFPGIASVSIDRTEPALVGGSWRDLPRPS